MQGGEPVTQASSRPLCPPGPLSGVKHQLAVDGVGDLALQAPDRFTLRLSLGDPAQVVAPAVRVGLADLADGGHVDGVVEHAVAAS